MDEEIITVWFSQEELDRIDRAVEFLASEGWPIRTREEFMTFATKRGLLELAEILGIDASKFCDS